MSQLVHLFIKTFRNADPELWEFAMSFTKKQLLKPNWEIVYKLFILLNSRFLFGETWAFSLLRKVPSETLCSLVCHKESLCSTYLYATQNMDENCLLKSNVGESPPIPGDFNYHYSEAKSNHKNPVYQLVKNSKMDEEASKAGFNYWMVVNGIKYYFSRESQSTKFSQAILQCFLKGGILPMERTDEFIVAMSILANDSATPRFTSLARELTKKNGLRHLTWNLGLKEWGEDENGTWNSKFQNWPETNYDSYLFKIEPTTKLYIPSSIDETTDVYFCQYVGKNLATGKPVTSVSTHKNKLGKHAVDGNLWSFWHASHNHRIQPDWISVDLGDIYSIEVVMWIARINYRTERNRNVQVWVGNFFLETRSLYKNADLEAMSYCGIHPYSTPLSILSGVTCGKVVTGQYVTLVNYNWRNWRYPMQIGEIGVFGSPHQDE